MKSSVALFMYSMYLFNWSIVLGVWSMDDTACTKMTNPKKSVSEHI